ncbi:MAG: hypothetical protein WCY25_08535 [Moheibacter sp.]
MVLKNIVCVILLLSYSFSYANKDIVVKENYGNVKITFVTGYYYEEINKSLIIAQYAKELSEKLSYKDTIHLIFFHQYGTNPITKYSFIKTDNIEKTTSNINNITIQLNDLHYDIVNVLKFIEYGITNLRKQDKLKKYDVEEIFHKQMSNTLKETLNKKIYRPEKVPELTTRGFYTYYYLNEKYVIVNKLSNEKIYQLEKISQFNELKDDLIFFESHTIYYYRKNKEIETFKIENLNNYSKPYYVNLISDNKVIIGLLKPLKDNLDDRLLILYPDLNLLIQDIDEKVVYQN